MITTYIHAEDVARGDPAAAASCNHLTHCNAT